LKRCKLSLQAEIFEENAEHKATLQICFMKQLIILISHNISINNRQKNLQVKIFIDETNVIVTQSNFRYIMKYISSVNHF
jgi:hypothetical protein